MNLSKLIERSVKKAFNVIGDLATVVTLTRRSSTGFDFSTGVPSGVTTTSISLKCAINWTKREQTLRTSLEVGTTRVAEAIFSVKDLIDPTIYDTLIMPDGSVWTMIPPYVADNGLITVNIAKEA